MAATNKANKVLVTFNVKNGQYALPGGEVKPLAWLTRVSLEKNLTTQPFYGDGEIQRLLVNDKGFTGVLGMTARDEEFEKDLGFLMEVQGGLATVQQSAIPSISLYFETEYMGTSGPAKTKKVWLFEVEVSTPNEEYAQNEDDISVGTVEYNMTIKGTYLKAVDGQTDYTDAETGGKKKVFKLSATPEDDGYETFGDSVPIPTVKAEEGVGE
jgi:hypothetical protein